MRARATLSAAVLLLLALPVRAHAQADAYTPCPLVGDAIIVAVSGTTCEDVTPVVTALLAQAPDAAVSVLAGAGWSALRARRSAIDGEHDLIAIRGLATLRLRRSGVAPDLDGWQAGRELLFARKRLVGGRPAPNGSALCTSAFLVRLSSGRLGGLSAAHCGGLRKDRSVNRRNAALRRPPAPGIVLGRVQKVLTRSRRLDALVLPIAQGANRPASSVINRGIGRPPWRVVGTAQPRSGRQVCMTGRTSGSDECGRLRGPGVHRLVSRLARVTVHCTEIEAAQGDSGGPVYTAPAADGTVHAVGIVTLIAPIRGDIVMCFTPIEPVLKGLSAKIVPASR